MNASDTPRSSPFEPNFKGFSPLTRLPSTTTDSADLSSASPIHLSKKLLKHKKDHTSALKILTKEKKKRKSAPEAHFHQPFSSDSEKEVSSSKGGSHAADTTVTDSSSGDIIKREEPRKKKKSKKKKKHVEAKKEGNKAKQESKLSGFSKSFDSDSSVVSFDSDDGETSTSVQPDLNTHIMSHSPTSSDNDVEVEKIMEISTQVRSPQSDRKKSKKLSLSSKKGRTNVEQSPQREHKKSKKSSSSAKKDKTKVDLVIKPTALDSSPSKKQTKLDKSKESSMFKSGIQTSLKPASPNFGMSSIHSTDSPKSMAKLDSLPSSKLNKLSKRLSKGKEVKGDSIDGQGMKAVSPERQDLSDDNNSDHSMDSNEMEPIDNHTELETTNRNLFGYECPSGYKAVDYKKSKLWLEDSVGPDKEIWLVRVPKDFKVRQIHGKEILLNGNVIIQKEKPVQGNDLRYMWEVQASRDDHLKASNTVLVLPSKKDKKLHAVKAPCGQMAVIKSVQTKPYLIGEFTKDPPKIPDGLKERYKPFGSDYEMYNDENEGIATTKQQKKKKKKSHKLNSLDIEIISPSKVNQAKDKVKDSDAVIASPLKAKKSTDKRKSRDIGSNAFDAKLSGSPPKKKKKDKK